MTIDTLPQGFVLRHPTLDDLEAVAKLYNVCEIAAYGQPEMTLAEMRTYWMQSDFNLATDAWLVLTREGQLVGVADVDHREHVRIFTGVDVHPDYRGRGIGTHLLQLVEERARQHIPAAADGARVALLTRADGKDAVTQRFLETHGYSLVRHFWRMGVELRETPCAATFEDWSHWTFKREGFDPSLWFLAMDGDEIAGFALCADEKEQGGWVHVLGVRRSWRRRGIGLALLHRAFAEFYRRGIRAAYLGVDAQSLTGATRLYERAGMHVVRQYRSYEKELRAGKELSTQSVEV